MSVRVTHRRVSILSRIHRPTKEACWEWQGAVNSRGYGVVRLHGYMVYVHRFMYAVTRGRSIARGKDVHHVCHNRRCANPNHLELLTRDEHATLSARQRWGKALSV